MGYYVDVETFDIEIPADNVDDCLAAINALHTDEMLEKQASGGRRPRDPTIPVREQKWYSWVDNPGSDGFFSICDALDAWRYTAFEDREGNAVIETANLQKWGDDEILLIAIAPFVRDGCGISFRGEDGRHWCYEFRDGKVTKRYATLVWDEGEVLSDG